MSFDLNCSYLYDLIITKMNFISRVVIICAIWTLVGVSACLPECDPEPIHTRVQDISIAAVEGNLNGIRLVFDNQTILTDEDTVLSTLAGFAIQTEAEVIAKIEVSGLFPGAFACDPAVYEPTETVMALQIVSSQPFTTSNSIYPPGASLENVFEVASTEEGTTIVGKPAFSRNAYYLKLKEHPTTPQQHRFTFRFTLSDGRQFSPTTPVIVIRP